MANVSVGTVDRVIQHGRNGMSEANTKPFTDEFSEMALL